MSDLDVAITSLIYPNEPAVALPLFQYSDAQVDVLLNGQRTAKVTIGVYDEILDTMYNDPTLPFGFPYPYGTCLQFAYRGNPIFWGPITNVGLRGTDGVIELSAVEPTLRTQPENHILVLGDDALDDANHRIVPPDYRGARMILNAARLNPAQIALDWPDIGIAEGTTNTEDDDDTHWLGFQRGDGVLDSLNATRDAGGFDIDFAPNWNDPDSPATAYCTMNVYDAFIPNPTNTVRFHFGFGTDTLEDFQHDWGGVLSTHAVRLSRDQRHRSDVAFNALAAEIYGVYENWDSTNYKAESAALELAARRRVKRYSQPPTTTRIVPRVDCGIRPIEDFWIGDTIFAEAKIGLVHFTMNNALNARVQSVTFRQADQSGNVAYDIGLEPTVSDLSIGTE